MGIEHAIVLAGGLGTRLRDAVPDLPKPMAPVAGRPFLEHLLGAWIAQGVGNFVLSVGYRAEAITAHFGESWGGARIRYAVEERPLGTGGALRLGSRLVPPGAPFLAMNGDTFLEASLAELEAFHRARGAELSLALAPHPGAARFDGVDLDPAFRVASLRGRAPQGGGWINGGLYLFGSAAPLEELGPGPCSFENDVLPAWIAAGRPLYGCPMRGRFIDIGVVEDYRTAQTLFGPSAPAGRSQP